MSLTTVQGSEESHPSIPSEPLIRPWPNVDTVLRAGVTAVNAFSYYSGFEMKGSFATASLFRVALLYHTAKEKNYASSALSIAATIAQFFTWGRIFAAAFDVIAEYQNFPQKPNRPYLPTRLDPLDASNARTILGLADDVILSRELLDNTRTKIVEALLGVQREKANDNPVIQPFYNGMIEDVNEAHATLCRLIPK